MAYIPEELVSMFYGGTSSNGARAYWVSFKEGVKALKENHVKHALGITVVRMIKVMTQFH